MHFEKTRRVAREGGKKVTRGAEVGWMDMHGSRDGLHNLPGTDSSMQIAVPVLTSGTWRMVNGYISFLSWFSPSFLHRNCKMDESGLDYENRHART